MTECAVSTFSDRKKKNNNGGRSPLLSNKSLKKMNALSSKGHTCLLAGLAHWGHAALEQYQFFFSKTSQEGTGSSLIASLISMIMSECYSPLAQFPPLFNAVLMGIKCNGYKKKHINKGEARAKTVTEKVLPLNTTKFLWKLRHKRKQAWTAKHSNDNAVRC